MATSKKTPLKKPRRVKDAKYKSFTLQKRIKSTGSTLPGAYRLFWQALTTLKNNWKVFLGILLIYGLIDFVVVQGFSAGQDYSGAKGTLRGLFSGSSADLASGIALFLFMVGSSGSGTSATVGPYQFIWIIVSSLALIWAFRQTYAKKPFRIRDSYYRGMYPFIPFILVLIVVAAELLPAITGGIIYNVVGGGVASTAVEKIMWAILFGLLILLSLYLVVASIFALYIVCLPEMTPVKALRASKQLVVNRRWAVLRKVAFLPVALMVVGGIIMIPIILVAAPISSWVFFLLTLLALPVLHSYYYALYRSLL